MRSTAFIAIVYLVFLLTQPCADVFAIPAENGPRAAIESGAWGDCEEGGETCSPFCVCSCCSVPVGYQHIDMHGVPFLAAPVRIENNFNYSSPFSGSFQTSVWQPPKR